MRRLLKLLSFRIHFPTLFLTAIIIAAAVLLVTWLDPLPNIASINRYLQSMSYEEETRFSLQEVPKQPLIVENLESHGVVPFKKPYTFSVDWISGHVPVWNKVLEPYKGKPDFQYLEIGVFEGRSLLWFLENVCTHPTSKITAIDPFVEPGVWEKITFNTDLSGAKDRIKLIKGYSQQELRKLPLHSFDVIYIDGDHSAAGALEDAVICWRLLKPGGLFIFDDYLQSLEQAPLFRPKPAIDCFYRFFGAEMTLIHSDFQVILRKNS